MPRRQNIRKAPTYHARLFEDEQKAHDWIRRMSMKMGNDYHYEVIWNDEFKCHWGRLWDDRDGEGYLK